MFLLIPVWWWMTKCNGGERTQLGDVLVRIPTRCLVDWMGGIFSFEHVFKPVFMESFLIDFSFHCREPQKRGADASVLVLFLR
jgi:hypothetical protein